MSDLLLQSRSFWLVLLRVPSWRRSCLVGVSPSVLVSPLILLILFGALFGSSSKLWLKGLSSRRMMMTSGGGVHYKSMFDAGSQVSLLTIMLRSFINVA